MYSSTLANINDTSARAENCGGVAKNWIILIKRHTFDSFHLFENYLLIDSQLPARLRITWLWLDVFLVFHKLINLFDSNDCYKDRRTICSCTRKGFFITKEIRDTQFTQHLPAESCLFDSCRTLRNRQRYSDSCYVIAEA